MADHKTGTREEWLAARLELLEAEKVPVDKEYVFETVDGKKTLAELFAGRSQLLVYHLMFGFGFRVARG
jgi:predicted dithiol-disulfide oxidoreductase (DUF899 family)